MNWEEKIKGRLKAIYKNDEAVKVAWRKLNQKLLKYPETSGFTKELSQQDIMLITYGNTFQDNGKPGLQVLKTFMDRYVKRAVNDIHILPMYPYTSDDGFSIVNYREINPELGNWNDIHELSTEYELMFDAVINHVSRSSNWFQEYLKCNPPYNDFFITCDPDEDYSSVTRPRALPLLTKVKTKEGEKYVWTTFSTDQIDLNYKCPDVLAEIIDTLLFFTRQGASFIRLDAIGFTWKTLGTSCMSQPETHEIIKLIKDVFEKYAPGTKIITETNVPQKENYSYFGNGQDEADLIYQFPLPPLTMYTFLTGDSSVISTWLEKQILPGAHVAFFNFLSSHDGIGMRQVEGILTEKQKQILINATVENGGRVSYKDNGDGTQSPYELNINYQDALAGPDASDEVRIRRFLAAETLLLSLQGVPGVYIHSLIGSRNDYKDVTVTGINRKINRAVIDLSYIEKQLDSNTNRAHIFWTLVARMNIRKEHSAFSPFAEQRIYKTDRRVIEFERMSSDEKILVLINVTGEIIEILDDGGEGTDLLTGHHVSGSKVLAPYQCMWIVLS